MILWFKNIFKKTLKPKVIRIGSCKKCGFCCRNITFEIRDKFITTEEEFDKLKSWKSYYNHFYISGKDKNGVMLFACKSLTDNNLCKDYLFRSIYCWTYPRLSSKLFAAGVETLDGCGYYHKSSVEFKDLLK